MTEKDQRRYNQIQEVLHARLTIIELSILINKSYRQTRRIVKKVKRYGMRGVKHGNIGKIPWNKTPEEVVREVQRLLKVKYFDFNFTHFREKLIKDESIKIGYEVIRKAGHAIGIVKRPKRRGRKVHKPRPRMPKEGQLIQFDGSPHRWFGDDGPECTLIGGIDDSTGKITGLEFFAGEDTLNCMKAMHDIVAEHGIPDAWYVDQAGHFGRCGRKFETQIARALKELGSEMILAHSCQGKGKIERLWDTMQDRLIAEMRLRGINRIPQANEYLKKEFITEFNKQFEVPSREKDSAYKKLNTHVNLGDVFSVQETRKISQANTFSYKGETYVLEGQSMRYRQVTIHTHTDGSETFKVFGKRVHPYKLDEFGQKKAA